MANTFANVHDLPQISPMPLPPLHPPPAGNTFNGEMMQLGSTLNLAHPHQTIYEYDRRVMMMMTEEDEGASSKKRRLGVNQVRFLESSFKEEKKLEPERKAQIAQQLGLQPRQVAIWFQNRRARSRSKQLERDYIVLKSLYDVATLEKQKLQDEVLHLKKELNNIRSTKQHEEHIHINKQQSMGRLKHALETLDASINANNSYGDYKEQDSHEGKTSSLLPLTTVKPRDTTISACEGAIILRTTKDHDTQQPQCHRIVTTNLAQHISIKLEGEDCRQLVYSNRQCLDDTHHYSKFHHWHDIWSD